MNMFQDIKHLEDEKINIFLEKMELIVQGYIPEAKHYAWHFLW